MYKTGDLFLGNRWSVLGMMNRLADPEARWSEVGIFVVDKQSSTENSVKVMLLNNDGVVVEGLSDILKEPTLQSAAHRSLNKKTNGPTVGLVREYVSKIRGGDIQSLDQENLIVHGVMGQDIDQASSSIGTKLNPNGDGRDLRVSGFVKGDPNSKLKSEFTSTDLVGSILAYAKLIDYDPDVKVSNFQEGGLVDDNYGEENPLFPSHVSASSRVNGTGREYSKIVDAIIENARQEAEQLVLNYLQANPAQSFNNHMAQTSSKQSNLNRNNRHSDNAVIDGYDEFEDIDAGIRRNAAAYPDQQSNVISMASIRNRRGETTELAEEVESNTIDKKIRQREQQAQKHNKPKPNYKG